MDSVTRFQILDGAVRALLHANPLEKCMNPIVLPPAMGK